ncbi:hypothetical protein [Tumebacillus permanentifrigoris]|nr:hypothetical protein [Tumebacillus permanentifrigoris]
MVEVPAIMAEWDRRDAMLAFGFYGVPGAGQASGGSSTGYDPLKNQEFDAGEFERLRMLTGGSA